MPATHQYRITKFDPANRDSAGHYIADDWYLHSQIGESFGGVLLTEDEYLLVESAYIATAMDFHREAGLPDIFGSSEVLVAEPDGEVEVAEKEEDACAVVFKGSEASRSSFDLLDFAVEAFA